MANRIFCQLHITVKPFLSYFLLSFSVAADWSMASREGVSGTLTQLAYSSSFWPVIGSSYILHVPALRGYTSVNAENLGDFRKLFGRKVLN